MGMNHYLDAAAAVARLRAAGLRVTGRYSSGTAGFIAQQEALSATEGEIHSLLVAATRAEMRATIKARMALEQARQGAAGQALELRLAAWLAMGEAHEARGRRRGFEGWLKGLAIHAKRMQDFSVVPVARRGRPPKSLSRSATYFNS